jgi:hypothetical protein
MFEPRLTYNGIKEALNDYENGYAYINGDKVEFEGIGQKIRFAIWNKDNTFIEYSLNLTEQSYLAMRIAEEVWAELMLEIYNFNE